MRALTESDFDDIDDDLGDISAHRLCQRCHGEFPIDPKYWGQSTKHCVSCSAEIERDELNRRVAAKADELMAGGLDLLSQLADNPNTGLPHLDTMLEQILNCFGGSQGFAKRLMADYLAAKPGGRERLQYAKMIVTMAEKCSQDAPVLEGELVSSEEIDKRLGQKLLEVLERSA